MPGSAGITPTDPCPLRPELRYQKLCVPISLSSLSDSTGASGSGGGAAVGGGPQGQPPYKSQSTLLQHKNIKPSKVYNKWYYNNMNLSPGMTPVSWVVEGSLHPCCNIKLWKTSQRAIQGT